MNFNKGEFTKLREDMKAVLAGLEEKYHLDFEFGSITYGEYEFKMKVSAKKTDIGDVRKIDFERKCRTYGFSPEDYERKVKFGGDEYIFVGEDKRQNNGGSRCSFNDGSIKQGVLTTSFFNRQI